MMEQAWRVARLLTPRLVRSWLRPPGRIGAPHLPDAAITAIRNAIRRGSTYLEFGSGGSTRAFAPLAGHTVSVESDQRFARAVRRALPRRARRKTLILHIDIGETSEWGYPAGAPTAAWDDYSAAVWSALPAVPDVVLIDGRFRVACAIETSLRCPPGTTVFIDDFGDRRSEYAPMLECLAEQRMIGRVLVATPRPDLDRARAAHLLAAYRRDPS